MPKPRGTPRPRSASTPGRMAEAMTTASTSSRMTSDETSARRAISYAVSLRDALGTPGALRDRPRCAPGSPAAVFYRVVRGREYRRHLLLGRVGLPHEDV